MKAYIIKSAKNNRDLEDLVNEAISEGYTPQGGVQNDGSYFHQAMVKAPGHSQKETLHQNAEEVIRTSSTGSTANN